MKLRNLFIVLFFLGCEQEPIYEDSYFACISTIQDNNVNAPGSQSYESTLQNMINSGIPGAMLTVHNENGYSSYAKGYADLASKVALQPCHITRVGSTVKTFTSVSILLLQESGKLNIDDPISNYLSREQIKDIENASKVTIRQLLQHSSGIYNYIQNLQFQTASLNDLTKIWQPEELLDYARGKDAYFSPGTNVRYSNTNYILLGMIIDEVTQRPFYEFFEEQIFRPLGMEFTEFAAINHVPKGIIRGYIDLYSNLNLIDTTYYSGWDYFTADGGLISNTYDLNIFLTNLFHGKLLSESSMEEFTNWSSPNESDHDGFPTYYGLGIFKVDTDYGPAYLHSGDAIGYFASMVYFPKQDITISWAVNGNYGRLDKYSQSTEAMESIFKAILK